MMPSVSPPALTKAAKLTMHVTVLIMGARVAEGVWQELDPTAAPL